METFAQNTDEMKENTGMRVVERGMKYKSKVVSVFEYVVLVLCILFVLLFVYELVGGISMVIKDWEEFDIGAGIGVIAIIISIPMILLFTWPIVSIIKGKRKDFKVKKSAKLIAEGKRLEATIKLVDLIDYKYAKDVFWVVCDCVDEEENIINRYISHRVKVDLFQKVQEGDCITVYVNPDNPDNYYVDLETAIKDAKRIHNGEMVKND